MEVNGNIQNPQLIAWRRWDYASAPTGPFFPASTGPFYDTPIPRGLAIRTFYFGGFVSCVVNTYFVRVVATFKLGGADIIQIPLEFNQNVNGPYAEFTSADHWDFTDINAHSVFTADRYFNKMPVVADSIVISLVTDQRQAPNVGDYVDIGFVLINEWPQ